MAKKKAGKNSDKEKKLEWARLAWQILGAKFLYYEGTKHGLSPSIIPTDADYDKWEDRYKELCEELGEEPTASNMVGFDSSRPSCRMVMEHLIQTNGRCPMRFQKLKFVGSSENPIQEVRKQVNTYFKELCDVLEEVGIDEDKAKKIRIKMKKRFKV